MNEYTELEKAQHTKIQELFNENERLRDSMVHMQKILAESTTPDEARIKKHFLYTFAGQAMQGILSAGGDNNSIRYGVQKEVDPIAKTASRYAKALLAELKKEDATNDI